MANVPMQPVRMKENGLTTAAMTKIALLGAIAAVLMWVDFPIPFFPAFLKLDLGDVPAIIGTFVVGPVGGILIELIKNLINLLKTYSGGVGELANFIVGVAYVVPLGLIVARKQSFVRSVIGMIVGIGTMTAVAAVFNYYILIPFYAKMMPMDAIIGLAHQITPAVTDLKTLILFSIVPFNIFKGVVVGIFAAFTLKVLYPFLVQMRNRFEN